MLLDGRNFLTDQILHVDAGDIGNDTRRQMNKGTYEDFLGRGWSAVFERYVESTLRAVDKKYGQLDEYMNRHHLHLLAEYYEVKIVHYRPKSFESDTSSVVQLKLHEPITHQAGRGDSTIFLLYDRAPTLAQFTCSRPPTHRAVGKWTNR